MIFKVRTAETDREVFPFPVFYLFSPDTAEVMRKSFDVMLCFQARLYLAERLHRLVVAERGEPPTQKEWLLDVVPDLLSGESKWQIGVPILTIQKDGVKMPAFLGRTEAMKKAKYHPFNETVVEDFGYLLRGPDVIQPPCLACPHILLHDAGGCRLGDTRCYGNLVAYLEGATYEERTTAALERGR